MIPYRDNEYERRHRFVEARSTKPEKGIGEQTKVGMTGGKGEF